MSKSIKLYEHPDYEELSKHWEVYRVLYEADRRELVKSEYLWPHELEAIQGNEDSVKIRNIRVRRSQYTNWLEPILSRYTSLFFKEPPDVSEVEELFGDYIKDVDGRGNSLEQFIKAHVTKAYLLYGRPIILTDGFNLPAKTAAEEKALGKRPFWELLDALSVKDWQIEELDPALRGKFAALRWEYDLINPRVDLKQEPETVTRSKEFVLEGGLYKVYIYEKEKEQKVSRDKKTKEAGDWRFIDVIEIPEFEELPIASVEGGRSWFKDVAPKALQYFNEESCLDNILLYQAHERLWFAGPIKEEHRKAMAEYTVGILPQDTQLLQATAVDPVAHERRLSVILNQMQRIAFNQSRTTPDDSRQVEAADTQREVKDDFVNLIVSSIEEIEDLVNRAVEHWAIFEGRGNYKGRVKLNKDVSIEDVKQQLNIFNALRQDIEAYPTWKREMLEKFAKITDVSDEAMKEIKELPLPRTQEPGIGNATNIRTELQERVLNGNRPQTNASGQRR